MAVINDNNKPMDQHTINLLNKVTTQINTNNQKLVNTQQFTGYQNGIYQQAVPSIIWDEAIDTKPSPNIDMENPIYKNEFEECGSVEIGTDEQHAQIINGVFQPPMPASTFIGLIDEVSEDEDDLYAKLPDGEIIPFNGHKEKITVTFDTWNDLQRSDLIGSEVKKAAYCKIYINDRLARVIEGTEVQDLLVKADRAIEELKVQPFSICRDGLSLIGREIYYDNQPAIINNIDKVNNLISIIPDSNYLSKFVPPPHALEDDDGEEWIETYGLGMLIRDYDEKIWWWRNTDNGVSVDPSTDPYYKQFPQVLPQPPSTTSPWVQVAPYTPSITQTPSGGLWTTIPISPYTQYNNIDDTVTWTMTDNTYTVTGGAVDAFGNTYTTDIDPVTGAITESYGTADYNPIKKTPKKYTQAKAYNKTKQKGAEVI